ncbi:hypothetical protein G6F31_017414 [Rhizopus arrhizus]|nr:hypothetical protein G6F31_017414 [Rhizopus arrhizus]
MRLDRPPASTLPSMVVVVVRVVMGMCGLAVRMAETAPLAPLAVAVLVVLLLPDRALVLDRFDQLPAGTDGLVTGRAAGSHHHRHGADTQATLGMGHIQLQLRPERSLHVRGQALEFVQYQRLEQVPGSDTAAIPSAGSIAACARSTTFAMIFSLTAQPPLTGGRIATRPSSGSASWSRSTRCWSANAE